jgi:hypothetical protein
MVLKVRYYHCSPMEIAIVHVDLKSDRYCLQVMYKDASLERPEYPQSISVHFMMCLGAHVVTA